MLGGAGLAVQSTWNARLRLLTGSPVLTTIVSLTVSLIALMLLWVSGSAERGSEKGLFRFAESFGLLPNRKAVKQCNAKQEGRSSTDLVGAASDLALAQSFLLKTHNRFFDNAFALPNIAENRASQSPILIAQAESICF